MWQIALPELAEPGGDRMQANAPPYQGSTV
jgi:hypothetical protein